MSFHLQHYDEKLRNQLKLNLEHRIAISVITYPHFQRAVTVGEVLSLILRLLQALVEVLVVLW